MLKTLVMVMFMFYLIKDWSLILSGTLLVSFVTLIYHGCEFHMFSFGWGMGVDHLSWILIALSIWIMALILISSMNMKFTSNFPHLFTLTSLSLLLFLILTFSSLDLLMFYITFEASLIPTLILILGWGYQPERIQAGIYMIFYTLFASLPLLVSLLFIYKSESSLIMCLPMGLATTGSLSFIWFLSSIMAFVVKLPMYLFHLWLPKAHVEAPLAGSMILAGVLLKLGGYGMIRILPLFSEESKAFSWLWISLGLLGGFFVSLICLRQIDMKSLIAYSSVAHMSLVLGGLLTLSSWGLNGAVVIMVGHGLCSSGLFCLANMAYERVGSRSLLINKGLLNLMPSLALWWFLFSVGNMAAPPSINLLGEITLIISLVSWSKTMIISIALLSFFSAAYSLYLYSLSQHGVYSHSVYSSSSGSVCNFMTLSLHWIPLNILIFKSSYISLLL